MAAVVSGAGLVTVAGAGHLLPLEQPQAVSHALHTFLNELPPEI